jgi:hypothetical protein
MKFLQSALCGFLLAVTASAQTAATPKPATSATPAPAAAPTPKISTLGGDEVKGPEHPLTPEQMKVLYVALGYQKQIAEMDENRAKMIAQNKTRNPYISDAVWADLDSSFNKVDYEAALYDVYKKYLSTDDAAKLIEFAKTPAGKDYLDNVAILTRESTTAVQRQQQQVSQQVQARHKDEIEAAMKKYREEHAPKPAPSLGSPAPAPGAAAAAPAKPATPPAATPAPAAPQN